MVAQAEREKLLEKMEMRMLWWSLTKRQEKMKIFVKQLESLVSQTRKGKQDCDGMGTCSEEKMMAVSKRSRQLKCMVVGVADVERRDGYGYV